MFKLKTKIQALLLGLLGLVLFQKNDFKPMLRRARPAVAAENPRAMARQIIREVERFEDALIAYRDNVSDCLKIEDVNPFHDDGSIFPDIFFIINMARTSNDAVSRAFNHVLFITNCPTLGEDYHFPGTSYDEEQEMVRLLEDIVAPHSDYIEASKMARRHLFNTNKRATSDANELDQTEVQLSICDSPAMIDTRNYVRNAADNGGESSLSAIVKAVNQCKTSVMSALQARRLSKDSDYGREYRHHVLSAQKSARLAIVLTRDRVDRSVVFINSRIARLKREVDQLIREGRL